MNQIRQALPSSSCQTHAHASQRWGTDITVMAADGELRLHHQSRSRKLMNVCGPPSIRAKAPLSLSTSE